MVVSAGLQSYFDKKRSWKKGQIQKRFADLRGEIAPEFLESFENFHTKVMEIFEETPEAYNIVEKEVTNLETNLERMKGKKNIRIWGIIADNI